MVISVNDYLRDINEASKNGRLTFFVGAGVSKLSKYPDWKELTNEFVEKLGLEKKMRTQTILMKNICQYHKNIIILLIKMMKNIINL